MSQKFPLIRNVGDLDFRICKYEERLKGLAKEIQDDPTVLPLVSPPGSEAVKPHGDEDSLDTPTDKENLTHANQLYDKVKNLIQKSTALNENDARIIVESADDAIREFGNTKQEKKVELRKWKAEAEMVLPPNTLEALRNRAEERFLKKSYPKSKAMRSILLTLVIGIVIVLGLLSLKKIFWDSRQPEDYTRAGLTTQRGVLLIPELRTYEIFYPQPFASVPNLTFSKMVDKVYTPVSFELLEQRPDGFKIRINGVGGDARAIEWIAIGSVK